MKNSRQPTAVPPHLRNQPLMLHMLAQEDFVLRPSYLKTVVQALVHQKSEAPRIFCLDTEFTRTRRVTEIGIVDLRSGLLVVNVVFDREDAFYTAMKLKTLQDQPEFNQHPSARHVPIVSTIPEAVDQLKECRFNSTDILIEYSPSRRRLLDFQNIRRFLEQHGHDPGLIVPDAIGYSCMDDVRRSPLCRDILKLPGWNLTLLFAVLFPQHPLALRNHSAAVDAMQLAHIIQLIAELSKPKEDRHLPVYLLKGLKDAVFNRSS
jgi:hypothetical protein